jgi:hypothetical protein
MITTTGRFPEEPLPRLGPESAEAPEFPVTFSRPADGASRSDTRPNSFRWFGKGTVRVMERGVLVNAKRRRAIGFHVTEQRFVPAWEICDVCREGNVVRVDLRSDPRDRDFFQFWTAEASTAGTIVRLLPTTRTIEYEEVGAAPAPRATATTPDRRPRGLMPLALVLVLISIAALITATNLRDRTGARILAPPPPATNAAATTTSPAIVPAPQHRPTDLEITNAYLALGLFDDRIRGLRAQFRMAFTALQHGDLSREDFIDGVNRWLVPQWRALYSELASGTNNDMFLESAVRRRLANAAAGWERALHEYVRGLEENNYLTVLGALEQMAAANESEQKAARVIEREAQ